MTEPRTQPDASHCEQCVRECSSSLEHLSDALSYSLAAGGRYVEGRHIALLVDTIAVCRTALDFLQRGSERSALVCATAAALCDECADDCDRFADDAHLRACAFVVRRCALVCRLIGRETMPVAA